MQNIFGESCKASAGSYPASHKPLQTIIDNIKASTLDTFSLELLTIGTINDMYCEMQRNEEPHVRIASQDDMDRF